MDRKEASGFGPASVKMPGKGRDISSQTVKTKNRANGVEAAYNWQKLFGSIAAAINRVSTLEELFRCLAEQLCPILPYDIACLALRTPDQESIQTQFIRQGNQVFSPTAIASIPLSSFLRLIKPPDEQRYFDHLPEKWRPLFFPEAATNLSAHSSSGSTKADSNSLTDSGLENEINETKHSQKNYYPAVLLIPLYGAPIVSLERTSANANIEESIWGCLVVASRQRNAFTAPHGELLAALGNLLVSGIQRIQLMEENIRLLRQTTSQNISEPPIQEIENRRRDEEQENFVYIVSHNLKTPLTSIQGFANILYEELGSQINKEHRHFLERLRQSAKLMEKMVLDLLEFSRLGRYPFTLEMINVSELVETVIEDMRLLGQLQNVEFIFSPKNFDELRFYADSDELKTVFENLLTNAVKYRRPGVPLRIEIGWDEQPRFHALWVRDNGIGMEAAFQTKAFELFQRGANAGQIQGTGIGLAIVRRIIENHQGLVRVDSKLGEGTTVYFTLPKLDAPPTTTSRKTSKLTKPPI